MRRIRSTVVIQSLTEPKAKLRPIRPRHGSVLFKPIQLNVSFLESTQQAIILVRVTPAEYFFSPCGEADSEPYFFGAAALVGYTCGA